MPSPSTSQSTLRPDLGGSLMEFDLAADQAGYIGTRVLPVIESMKASGPFGKIPIEQLLQSPDTKRAPGAGYASGDFTFTSDTFTCEEHGFTSPVDDRQAQMYADFFDAELVAAARARNAVMKAYEIRVANLLFNTSTWTPTSVTTEWSTAASATPIDDVETEVQTVYANSGLWPNTLIITKKVFRNLRNVAQIVDRVKYQGFMDARAGNISVNALSAVFDLNVVVAGGTNNTANEGATASLTPIWDDEYAMICRVATTNDISEPCVGRTIHWGEDGSTIGATMESYRDEARRSDIIRARMDTDEKVLYTEAASLLDNITA